ncbi:asparagine synthase (glutamine-hydrolyzing) [Microlunatus lacustris]
MCGIAGWFDPTLDLREHGEVLQAMCDTQSCRGPDAEGVHVQPHAGLAHRRLAVLDPRDGLQPMTRTRDDGGVVAITYSGEVYNFQELREQLVRRGHRFHTRCDTEVVLVAYLEWGEQLVEHLVGIYAFAVWDPRAERLLLVRDRLGVKPLHWAPVGDGLVFGSEPKALLAHPGVDARIDGDGLVAMFALFGVHRPGRTVLAGISEVPPGCYLVAEAGAVATTRYWELTARPHTDTAEQTTARVRELLGAAVTEQLASDVPLCALVSGGIDSSAVAALAQGALVGAGHQLATFTVDFADQAEHFVPDRDRPDLDAPYVAALVTELGTDHHRAVLPVPDMAALQRRVTVARDLPAIGDLDSSLLGLFQAVQGRFTVALSGESADEVFGGYAWFHDELAVGRPGFPWMMDDLGLGNVLRSDLQQQLRPAERVRAEYAQALDAVPRLAGEDAQQQRYREVAHLALTRFLPVLLDRKDRTSMAVGVEVRVPFCDHRLVEYVWNVPWSMRHPGGRTKGLLRDAVADLLPPALLQRPKAMFPTVTDPGYDQRVRDAALGLLTSSRIAALLDHDRVRALVEGRTPRPAWLQRMALAYLAQIDFWLEHYDVAVEL